MIQKEKSENLSMVLSKDFLRLFSSQFFYGFNCFFLFFVFFLKKIPQKLDKNRNGKITRSEFVAGCMEDGQIVESLDRLKTVW